MKPWSLVVLISTSVLSLTSYASNPHANQQAASQTNYETKNFMDPLMQGTYIRRSWADACPDHESVLLTGCFATGSRIARSPIAVLVNPMWSAVNTEPNFTENSVYIKKFPPGYTLSANRGRNLTYDATRIPSNSKAWCTSDPIAENGMDIDCNINNDPNSSTNDNCIYSVSNSSQGILSGAITTQQILRFTPHSGTALPLAIPIYIVCIGTDRTTGSPASIAGMNVY